MVEKNIPWWRRFLEVEQPKKERVFLQGAPIKTILSFIISLIIGFGLLFVINYWNPQLPLIDDRRYAFPAWSASYFIYFFLMIIPIIVANLFYHGTKTPIYGFASISGFIVIAVGYSFFAPKFGVYMALTCSFAFLGNIPSQGDYKLKWRHIIFYFLLGIVVSYVNAIYQMIYWDVWVWLQIIHLHLFMTIIAAVKIRQWAYTFMFGWAIFAIYCLITPELFILRLISPAPFHEANLLWVGIYNLLVPPLLTLVILTYFFRIQRRVKARYIGMDK
jgi:hypothetical protein